MDAKYPLQRIPGLSSESLNECCLQAGLLTYSLAKHLPAAMNAAVA
jgi:hypothetical protein